MNIPESLKYTKEHEWIRIEGDVAVVGITDFAQGELGELVYVEVETVGQTVEKDEIFGSCGATRCSAWSGQHSFSEISEQSLFDSTA